MVQITISRREGSSFRDPAGFVFFYNDTIYRQINWSYKEHYDHLMESGLFQHLVENELIVPHVEVKAQEVFPRINNDQECCYKLIKPEVIPFISYPYEWCYTQLKHAALTIIKILKIALEYGMILKDASGYNIQFRSGKPILIDTLSFEKYREGKPWVAYRQFCQHFLAPLALMAYKDVRLNQLLRVHLDGIPLNLASKLLPFKTYFRFSTLSHIHLHALAEKRYEAVSVDISRQKVSRRGLLALIDNLESAISNFQWRPAKTVWSSYYSSNSYSAEALSVKKTFVSQCLDLIKPRSVWDIGANIGIFSQLAAERQVFTVALDADPAVVERNYLDCVKRKERFILPLVMDITNPSPGIGWVNRERRSLLERGPADMVFALALIHHLVISNNMPVAKLAEFFGALCNFLVIEFVPENDPQVQRLIKGGVDSLQDYNQQIFEHEFAKFFNLRQSMKIKDSGRILYLMERKGKLF